MNEMEWNPVLGCHQIQKGLPNGRFVFVMNLTYDRGRVAIGNEEWIENAW